MRAAAFALVLQGLASVGAQTYSVSLSPYPGYTGTLLLGGNATIDNPRCSTHGTVFGPSCQAMSWDLTGADTNGGIHIHDGTSCQMCADTTCGHYYDHGSGRVDPWPSSTYTSASGSGPPIDAGLYATAILGKVVVVHDSAGVRIGCGLISDARLPPPPPPATTPEPEPAPEPAPDRPPPPPTPSASYNHRFFAARFARRWLPQSLTASL